VPYNITITHLAGHYVVVDKNEQWIEEHVARPRREGRDILFDGVVMSWDGIHKINITHTRATAKQSRDESERPDEPETTASGLVIPMPKPMWSAFEFAESGDDVTDRFITGAPGRRLLPAEAAEQDAAFTATRPGQGRVFADNRKAVMVIYGHDTEANNAMFSWLRDIGLQPQEWSQLVQLSGVGSPYIGQVLERAFQEAQAVVALFTPDERVRERGMQRQASSPWRLQARPNVLIEAGMALVTHPDRTVLVALGPQELPSDLAGRHHVRLDGTSGPLNDMANRLKHAGCKIDKTGTRWLDPARFPDRHYVPAQPLPN